MCPDPTTILKYMDQMLIEMKREIGESILIIKNFNTSLSKIGQKGQLKINKNIKGLNNTIKKGDIFIMFIANSKT